MTRINYWCYLQDNKIKGKWKFGGEWCSLWGGYNKKQHTGKDAAFLMKFILKQYEQKSATHVFILILSLFALKKLSICFSPNQNQQIAPDKYFCEGNSRNLTFKQ